MAATASLCTLTATAKMAANPTELYSCQKDCFSASHTLTLTAKMGANPTELCSFNTTALGVASTSR